MKKFNSLIIFIFLIILEPYVGAQTPGFWNSSTIPTVTNNSLGVGTLSPLGMEEVFYCNDSYYGLIITKDDCGIYNVSPLDFINPTFDAKLDPATSENSGSTSTTFTLPINFKLTGYNTSLAKPMFWARLKYSPSYIQTASGPYTSRFIVTPYGRSGFNVENPRATLDIKSLAGYNVPALIVGRQAVGTTDKTQHFHYVPLLDENGYNQISVRNDQGFFYTDGKGTNGANSDGSFIIAPWADNSSNDYGGIRLDPKGNMYVHGNIYSTKLKVQVKWWSDYVFDSSYKLRPLSDLEKYINTNKHLPDFQSENEIKNNGIDVSEMFNLQQKQIEELTLYIIQLQKELDIIKKSKH